MEKRAVYLILRRGNTLELSHSPSAVIMKGEEVLFSRCCDPVDFLVLMSYLSSKYKIDLNFASNCYGDFSCSFEYNADLVREFEEFDIKNMMGGVDKDELMKAARDFFQLSRAERVKLYHYQYEY